MATTRELLISQGKTFVLVLRWETEPIIYKVITSILQAAPVRIVAAGHSLPDGWRAAITNVRGMTEVNAEANRVRDADYHPVTVIDANTVEINDINAAGFKAYVSGGYLQFNTPVDISGYTARMSIKDKIGGTVLASTNALDAPLNILTITLDQSNKTITLTISAMNTAAITWRKGVYDLEMVSGSGVVTALLTGLVSVGKEVTT